MNLHALKRVARPIKHHPALVKAATRVPPPDSARAAGLTYTTDTRPGIRRLATGTGFKYVAPDGRTIRDAAELQRIRALVIPPAWTDVWISPDPRGHLQATGRDARGRKQYRYHPRWRDVRDETKYERMIAFARALPIIRHRTDADLGQPGLPRTKVLAAVVQLLEKTLIRIGNDEYARDNQSFGLTTLRDGHVQVKGSTITFSFKGKSGVEHEVDFSDRRLAPVVKACRDIPGYDLFQYYDGNGERQSIGSSDVNAYLKDITGLDFTSKDFRTWAGTVLAAQTLETLPPCDSQTQAKKNIVRAVEAVARRLGNTKAVSRKCYIHPAIFEAYVDGTMMRTLVRRTRRAVRASAELSEQEESVLALLQARATREPRRKAS